MGTVVDTSWLIARERSLAADPSAPIGLPPSPLLSAISIAELCFGLELSDESHRAQRQDFIDEVVRTGTVLPFGTVEAREYARLAAHLRRAGTPIGDRDLMIAATAVANGHSLVTLNAAEFARVPGLTLLPNPLASP